VVLARWPAAARGALAAGHRAPPGPGWPTAFVPLDSILPALWPAPRELESGAVTLLGATRMLSDDFWRSPDDTQLWRFHAHYWDWAWGLLAHSDRAVARQTFARWYRSWVANTRYGRMDEWAPYVVSLRAWSWCGQFAPLVAGTPLEAELRGQLQEHRDFLLWHLERDVGGNHLLKNVKALVGLAVFLGEGRLLDRAARWFVAELGTQVLDDGGHHERSPAYHCQVLADVLDVHGLLHAAGHRDADLLPPFIDRMREWLDAVVDEAGRVPALNDGYPVPAQLLDLLLPERSARRTVVDLPQTGLTIAEQGPWRLLLDNGDPCPDDLPAHAHADTLALELHIDGRLLVCDTGTSTYRPGATRSYERSTAAHSTVTVDETDSTEVWGAFRAGRRARVTRRTATLGTGVVQMSAAHDGYRRLPGRPLHTREVAVRDGNVVVSDTVTGNGHHDVRSRFHLVPGSTVARLADREVQVSLDGGPTVRVVADQPLVVEWTARGVGHERTLDAPTLVIGGSFELPTTLRARFVAPAAATSPATDPEGLELPGTS
jgi:uncharacterized heparinase superfamily protein